MSSINSSNNVDSLATFVFLKRLLTPITQMDCYKLGLVDTAGNIIKTPETEEELNALNVLARTTLFFKKQLGTKINTLHNFLYLLQTKNDYVNKLNTKDNVLRRAEIMRISSELDKLTEKYDMSLEEFLLGVIQEQTLNETPHVEIMDDKFIDFRREDNPKWILKLISYYQHHKNNADEINKHLRHDSFFKIAFNKDVFNLNKNELELAHKILPKELFN
jgi:hypothetical protein